VGSTIRVRVSASNGGGQRSVDSDPTAPVDAIPPSNLTRPKLTGTAREGEKLALDTGGWKGSAPFTYGYRWERCGDAGTDCTPIDGAASATYTLSAADVGARVRGVVSATNHGGSDTAASDPSGVVAARPIDPGPGPDPAPDPLQATLGAVQWKSSSGTGLRVRIDSVETMTRVALAIPASMLPRHGDAGRTVGRVTIYPAGGHSRTWTLRYPRSGAVLLRGSRIPRVALAAGAVRLSGVPAGVRLVKLTLYTRNATNPHALVPAGSSVGLSASVRSTAGRLSSAAYRLTGAAR
jgi:hypothetical protein